MAQKQSEVWPPPLPVSTHSVRAASHWILAPLTSLIMGSAGLVGGLALAVLAGIIYIFPFTSNINLQTSGFGPALTLTLCGAAGAILGCTLELGILFVGKDLMRRH